MNFNVYLFSLKVDHVPELQQCFLGFYIEMSSYKLDGNYQNYLDQHLAS